MSNAARTASRRSSTDGADWVAAAALAGATALLDRWLVGLLWRTYDKVRAFPGSNRFWAQVDAHEAWKSAALSTCGLGVLVLVGALVGAARGMGNWSVPRARRWRSAMAGALLIHLVLPVLLIVGLILHPPTFIF